MHCEVGLNDAILWVGERGPRMVPSLGRDRAFFFSKDELIIMDMISYCVVLCFGDAIMCFCTADRYCTPYVRSTSYYILPSERSTAKAIVCTDRHVKNERQGQFNTPKEQLRNIPNSRENCKHKVKARQISQKLLSTLSNQASKADRREIASVPERGD